MKKNFPGQNLCSGAFGGNNRPYTKQRARHGSPFLEPPPPSFAGRPCHPPPPQSNFRAAMLVGTPCLVHGEEEDIAACRVGPRPGQPPEPRQGPGPSVHGPLQTAPCSIRKVGPHKCTGGVAHHKPAAAGVAAAIINLFRLRTGAIVGP